jgi:phosphoheptose isomerase
LPGSDRRVREILTEAIALHERIRDRDAAPVVESARTVVAALRQGGKVLTFGNGGSAADAQHFAAELVGRFEKDRSGWAAVALTTDTSALTAIANDYGFDRVFARQVEALARAGDVVVGISTSGASRNVVLGLEAARARSARTIALTGKDGGDVGRSADVHVNVPSPSAARVQEAHRTLIHAICELVESELAGG